MLWLDRTREHWKLHVPFEGMRPSSTHKGRSARCGVDGRFQSQTAVRGTATLFALPLYFVDLLAHSRTACENSRSASGGCRLAG